MTLRPAALLLVVLALPAAAETVYRCADGYSQKACPGGTSVQVGDSRSAAQRSESGEVVRRDTKLAERLQAERLKQEAQAPSAYIPATEAKQAAAVAKPRSKGAKKSDPQDELFTAGVPGSGPDNKKKKAPERKKDKAPA